MRGKRALAAGVGLTLLIVATPLLAQGNAACGGGEFFEREQARRVCNAAVDASRLFTPVVGLLISGGNPVLGSTSGLGSFPHFGLTLRANATRVVVPDVEYDGTTGTVAADHRVIAPAPLVEGAIGLFRGTHGGNFGLDLLLSAQLLPTKAVEDVSVDVNATRIGSVALGLGFGGRLTLLADRGTQPGLVVSVMRRTLPRIGVGNLSSGDNFTFSSDFKATTYRAVLGKRFGPLAIGAGGGWDQYAGAALIGFRDPLTSVPQPVRTVQLSDSRWLGFLDAGLALGGFHLVAEAGYQQGKALGLSTTFEQNDPAQRRLFGSVGIRLGF